MLNTQNISLKYRFSSQSKAKLKSEFYQVILKAAIASPNIELCIPETLISFSKKSSYMVYTSEEGRLHVLSNIKPEHKEKFFKRCYFYQRPGHPVTVSKVFTETREVVDCIMTVKESSLLWKKSEGDIFIIQRYIYPYLNTPLRARVEFFPQEKSFSKRLSKTADQFFAGNVFEEDSSDVEEDIKAQMQTLKKLIEIDAGKNQFISSVVADFLKEYEGKWYFISLASYKFEGIVPKVHTKEIKKKAKSQKTLEKSKTNSLFAKTQDFNSILTEELIRDLTLEDST